MPLARNQSNAPDVREDRIPEWENLSEDITMTSKPKIATTIPPEITTPDKVETRLGTLKFFDGFPDAAAEMRVAMAMRFKQTIVVLLGLLALTAPSQGQNAAGPLPSWKDGPARKAILDFVKRIPTEDDADYMPPAERVATFDNDGTLWCEQPVIQGVFLLERLKHLLPQHPEWKTQQPFKAALEMDKQYFYTAGEKAVMELFAAEIRAAFRSLR
jgi:hypothetical protein